MGTGSLTPARTRTRPTLRAVAAHRLEPDPDTAHVVAWMFAQRLAGHSTARIARALNEAEVPCPSAADPDRNPHRPGTAWTLGAVTSVLGNPRYTGRQVWNRQRTDAELADPADIALGHRQVQRWNLPGGWVISARPAHPALVSAADFIAAQAINAARGPVPRRDPAAAEVQRRYLMAGLLTCGTCGRRMESTWSNGKPAYRCRHGHTSAARPDPVRPKNAYVREEIVLAQLPAVHSQLTRAQPAGTGQSTRTRRRTRRGTDVVAQPDAAGIVGYLREHRVTLTWDQDAAALRAGTIQAITTQAG
jgi:site-specific DNA recombinase